MLRYVSVYQLSAVGTDLLRREVLSEKALELRDRVFPRKTSYRVDVLVTHIVAEISRRLLPIAEIELLGVYQQTVHIKNRAFEFVHILFLCCVLMQYVEKIAYCHRQTYHYP